MQKHIKYFVIESDEPIESGNVKAALSFYYDNIKVDEITVLEAVKVEKQEEEE